jgi:hypothetical protein
MKKLFFAILLLPSCLFAQGSGSIWVYLYGIPCNLDGVHTADGRSTGQQVTHLENFADGPLPNPLAIKSMTLWAEPSDLAAAGQTETFDSTTVGNVGISYDPQSMATIAMNYPISQNVLNRYSTIMGWLEFQPGYKRAQSFDYATPILYHPGDVFQVGPECKGGGVVNLIAMFRHTMGNLVPGWLAANYAPYTQIFSNPLTTVSNGSTPVSARNLVTIPTSVSPTKIRVHIAWPISAGVDTIISKLSACLQASGSTCAGTPVEMKCNGQSGIGVFGPRMFPSADMWCDWTALPGMLAGSNLLVTVSYFNGPAANVALASIGGLHEWSGTVDSTFSTTVLGTIYDNPGYNVGIDKVQVQ